ncbi:MAG: GTP 3',8-cyclase MoaA [Treponema sp.]|jgi:cyclic pyranopterin phosphate synthase|nr:GTP 3',8-cyclase MoaA [Treponema sp.]
MKDPFGRTIDYLRVSITDRCNLRCIYCMPPDGVDWTPHRNILSFEELLRICGLMAGLGIRRIKVTGGEPLVRRGAADFIASLKKLEGIQTVTLTSNGVALDQYLDKLISAGLDGLNISLDSLREENFRRITGGEGFEKIRSFLNRIDSLPLPVKINCVPLRGINEDELADLAGLAKTSGAAVRFIELMPLGRAGAFSPVPGKEVFKLLEKEYGKLTPYPGPPGGGPAVYYSVKGFKGKIGFINALSDKFCETCNRLRLTAQGLLKPCLSSNIGLDLRGLIRGSPENSGASNRDLEEAVRALIARKPWSHTFSTRQAQGKTEHDAGMFRTGG